MEPNMEPLANAVRQEQQMNQWIEVPGNDIADLNVRYSNQTLEVKMGDSNLVGKRLKKPT